MSGSVLWIGSKFLERPDDRNYYNYSKHDSNRKKIIDSPKRKIEPFSITRIISGIPYLPKAQVRIWTEKSPRKNEKLHVKIYSEIWRPRKLIESP
ncbi:MAG TPA: hypothetical protein VKM55_18940 [Candidatus Lokiarchaeia archaeon]|nr:hypothetical protein [Candidatus Lokiarchaeia archaeon]